MTQTDSYIFAFHRLGRVTNLELYERVVIINDGILIQPEPFQSLWTEMSDESVTDIKPLGLQVGL